MKLLVTSCIFLLLARGGFAQSGDTPTYIETTSNPVYSNMFTFSVENKPPLNQIAGAPAAHYSYFWEFGDGTYSFKEKPAHIYADSTGREKKVVVSLTNNYGSGGAPRMRSTKVKPEPKKPAPEAMRKRDDAEESPLSRKENIHLFTNHSPRPGDPIVCVLSYQNTDDLLQENGRIYLFYNEKELEISHFFFDETRTHHGELFYEGFHQEFLSLEYEEKDDERLWASSVSSPGNFMLAPAPKSYVLPVSSNATKEKVVSEGKRNFKNAMSWEYKDLKPGETRNIFTSLLCSSEMAIDTSKTITIRAVIVPENKEKTREYNLKMVIQSSHDPNKISVSDRKIRKSMIRRNGITYKVHFQNIGRGAARNIRVVSDLHPSLDPSSVELIDFYPKAVFCLTDDSVTYSCLDSVSSGQQLTWLFKNIYLPGTRQDDKENRRATKGWIEFSVKPKKGFKRKDPIDARSLIYFDKNEPIRTNRVKTRVERNWSYGAKAGFAEVPFSVDFVMLGATFSSFHPRSFYLQPEIMFSSLSHDGYSQTITEQFILTPDGNEALGDQTVSQSYQMQYLDVVPLQIRRNITPFASIGAGFQVSWLLKAKEIQTVERSYYPVRGNNGLEPPYPPSSMRESFTIYDRFSGIKDERFSSIETGFFLDVQGGLVRKGPSLGIRYQTRMGKRPSNAERSERQTNSNLQVYVQMRF